MNIEILRKCLLELGTDAPRLDYIRGMLETLIAMDPNNQAAKAATPKSPMTPMTPNVVHVPGLPPMGNLDVIKKMAGESL